MSKDEYLRGELAKEIKRFATSSDEHKRLFRMLRYGVFGLTALSTLLASIALTFTEYQQAANLAIVVVTAAAGIATSVEGLRKPAELWIHERVIQYALRDLERELEFRSKETPDPAQLDAAFAKLQAILGAAADRWSREIVTAESRKKTSDNSAAAPGPGAHR